jgi:hypothetical protein
MRRILLVLVGAAALLIAGPSQGAERSASKNGSGGTKVLTDLAGHRYSVTAISYYDPATPANEFLTASAGSRLVAVKFRIKNTGRSNVSDDANNDVTIIGSNLQIYQPSFDDVKGCTNFNSGEFGLAPGGTVVGCVVFEIPKRVRPTKVVFDPSSGFGGTSTAAWRLR